MSRTHFVFELPRAAQLSSFSGGHSHSKHPQIFDSLRGIALQRQNISILKYIVRHQTIGTKTFVVHNRAVTGWDMESTLHNILLALSLCIDHLDMLQACFDNLKDIRRLSHNYRKNGTSCLNTTTLITKKTTQTM
jgi:hypothetical protein